MRSTHKITVRPHTGGPSASSHTMFPQRYDNAPPQSGSESANSVAPKSPALRMEARSVIVEWVLEVEKLFLRDIDKDIVETDFIC